MRRPAFQRLICLLLLAGVVATLLPFGREAAARERWALWASAVAAERDPGVVHEAVLQALAYAPRSGAEFVQALTRTDAADPAWFGLDAFSDDALFRLEQQLSQFQAEDPLQAALTQSTVTTSHVVPTRVATGDAIVSAAARGMVLIADAYAGARGVSSLYTLLVGTALSPRAP